MSGRGPSGLELFLYGVVAGGVLAAYVTALAARGRTGRRLVDVNGTPLKGDDKDWINRMLREL